MSTLIRYRREIDAAHQLPYHDGKCARLHGHRWTIEVALYGEPQDIESSNPQSGMILDFKYVKETLDRFLPDHLSMNDAEAAAADDMTVPDEHSRWAYAMPYPTAELLAHRLYELLATEFAAWGVMLTYVRVWETPNGDAQYPAIPLHLAMGSL